MADNADYPFKAEYAKSGRASCKACHGTITKDSLRVAVMIQSPMFDGKIPNWYHHGCVWKRAKITDPTEIHGFDSLRWEDQKKLKDKIAAGGGGDAGSSSAGNSDFNTEYAKSSRSSCRGCEEKIKKDEVRISKKEYDSQRAKMYGPQDLWYHVDCFVEHRDDLGFGADLQPSSSIKGYNKLKEEDRDLIVSKLGKGEKKKRKSEDEKTSNKKQKTEETEEEKALREQSQSLWKVRDTLSKEVSNPALKILLEYNAQGIPAGESKLLDAVSDCMMFGALGPCPECKEGQLGYKGSYYGCNGNLTEWTKCMHKTQTPKRRAFKIPEEYHDVDFLKKYKYVKRQRVFPAHAAIELKTDASFSTADGATSGSKPLSGMKFVITVKTKTPKDELEKTIKRMGGKVLNKVDKTIAAVISTKAQVDKKTRHIADAEKHDIHVVDEEFLEAVKNGGAALLIIQHSIASWGSDPHDRMESKDEVDAGSSGGPKKSMAAKMKEKDEKHFTKGVAKSKKMTVKGGAAVDPDSGLEEKAHVYQEKGDLFTAVLGIVDIVRDTNSYYKLQLLEGDTVNRYWVFRAWGRVGTTIGGNKVESLGSKQNAMEHFKNLYAEKTGNEWEDRKNFVKYPNKFFPIDIDYGADSDEVKMLDATAGSNSSLPVEVQKLIKMIFDVESMKKAMLEFEIDLKKMPLGKLSKKQIESAYKVLTELQGLLEKEGTATQFLDCSNRFYTLIPHDFGMKKPPLINTPELLKNKIEMLDNLLEMEVAYSLMKSGNEASKDPLDVHYEQLKTKIEPMKKEEEDYKRLEEFVKNTHAATHNQYDLDVQEIFEVARDGERKRYRPFRELHNRQLLWHGSRTTNYAGILSQGLRIAPPEAPVTGYMFGKGIYFADMVSKSANYCRTSKSDPVGFLMLCEVALGNMHELKAADYVSTLPKGKHSTKGVGMTTPDPSGSYTCPDGTIIPMGKGCPASTGYSSLLYNEYIVYDVAQVNIKYMLQVKFNYKW